MSCLDGERPLRPGMPRHFGDRLHRVRQEFQLLAPDHIYRSVDPLPAKDKYVKPPESALLRAKRAVADFLRCRGGSTQDTLVAELITAIPAMHCEFPKGDIAWAVYQLAKEGLLEGRPPAGWSEYRNEYGATSTSGRFPDGTFGQLTTYEVPLVEGAVAPTEALWEWRRDNDEATAARPAGSGPKGSSAPGNQPGEGQGEGMDNRTGEPNVLAHGRDTLPTPTDSEARQRITEAVEAWKKALYPDLPGGPLPLMELIQQTTSIVAWRDRFASQIDVTPLDEVRRILIRRADGETTPEEELQTAGEGAARACDRIMEWLQSEPATNQTIDTPPQDTEQVVKADNVGMPAAKPSQKPPPDAAIKAYRLKWILGVPTQTEIAANLSRELGRPVSQGRVSRWLKQAEEFVQAGGVLPGLPNVPAERPRSIDPERLDLGRRQDGRTERQRGRRNEDD
jgi:hypothetical protein